ncbi:bis(5'-nucleosyl)-tetraphosphatase [Paucilactobacillus sp. N302-9]
MIEITSGAVVYKKLNGQIKYLLLQSTNVGNFWGFPKGHVEKQETLLETARREILEETNLAVTIDTDFKVQTNYQLPNGNQKEMTLFTAQVTDQDQTMLQEAEIKNADWFSYQAAREKLTYDNLKVLLDQVNDYLVTK